MVKKEDSELIDFYRLVPKCLLTSYHNPQYEKHKITIPFFGIIAGGTGSGKTQTLMNILKKMNGTFEKLILCVKSIDEPLYKHLIMKIPKSNVEVYEGGQIPSVDTYKDFDGQMIIIFDDLVGVKNQKPIEEWYIRGRKIAGGCSMLYLTQSWFRTPKLIRIQCNHIFLKRLTSIRDLNLVISDYGLTSMKDQIIKAYRQITNESKIPFLTIRTDAEPEERFAKNFSGFLKIDDGFGEKEHKET